MGRCGSGMTIFYALFSLLNIKTITNRFFCIRHKLILFRLLQCEFYLVMVTVSVLALMSALKNFHVLGLGLVN